MKLEVFHQLGHQHIWNLESFNYDSTGDGLILSPKSIDKKSVERFSYQIRELCLFDPQFFLPNFPKSRLVSYDFFPNLIADSFETNEYTEIFAYESAKKCVEFQTKNSFRYVVIPTRYKSGMPSNFIDEQEELFVKPFLRSISEQNPTKGVVLQLILNDNMIKDKQYAEDILNWVTGIKEIAGVYLITEINPRTTKQVKDIDFLYSLLTFVKALSDNGLDVILGYLNIEAILLSIASPKIVTIGSYENTRMFNIRNFQNQESPPRGPVPRLYCTKLLQWIDYRYIASIQASLKRNDFFDDNKYQALMFMPTYKWHFTKPELYKHYFLEFSKQLNELSKVSNKERYEAVCRMIESARAYYSQLDSAGIVFDSDNDGSHLSFWLTAANRFASDQEWR